VLGALGGDAAADALVRLLGDVDGAVREAAARAIGETGHWNAASALARCLGDPAFPVRRESALALRRLGGVGVLVLRRAREDANPFVVDMATQVLDLPDSVFHRMAA
jgi:HEAT repeat protein